MKDKLRIVFVPFVLALVGLTLGYTLLNWLLVVKLGLFHPKTEVTEFILPLLLAGLTTWGYITPKLKALQLSNDFFHTLLAFFGLVMPIIFAQMYMTATTGELTNLSSIEKIGNGKPTKYYALDSYRIDTAARRSYATYRVEGRNGDRFKMYFYAVAPICNTDADTLFHEPTAWLGIVYTGETSRRKGHEALEKEYNLFIRQSEAQFEHGDFSHFLCFERIDKTSKHYEGFKNALGQDVYIPSNPVILKGMDIPYEARDGNQLQCFFIAFFIVLAMWLLLSVVPKANPKELKRIKAGGSDPMAKAERQEWLNLIVPHKGYFITPIIIDINIAVFLFMVFMGKGFLIFQADDLLAWGACYAPSVSEGQWWRLLTAAFLHGSAWHLLVNMACLFYVGIHLEELMRRSQYLSVYLLSALAGSGISLLWHTEPLVAVGASGAIFGLYGTYIALLLGRVYPKSHRKSLLKEIVIFIGINLVVGILPGIDNAAHIGGLSCGFLLGFIFLDSCKRKAEENDIKEHQY